jgi:5-methylcytosine-specific restriction endonuclease McrA
MLEHDTTNGWEILWEAASFNSRPALARREVWSRYMTSREWNVKRRLALARAEGRCERCRHQSVLLQVHHLTYIRRFREWPEDLTVYCDGCHAYISAETNVDPLTMPYQPDLWRDAA